MKTLCTLLFLITIQVISLDSKIFKDKFIESENQVFRNTECIRIDSVEINYFSTGADTLQISFYSEKNRYNQIIDSNLIYSTEYIISSPETKKITLNLNKHNINVYREDIIVKVKSNNNQTRLLTSATFIDDLCSIKLHNKFQFHTNHNNESIYGSSAYLMNLYTSRIENNDIIQFERDYKAVDTTKTYTNNDHILLVDINKDNLLDLIVGGDYYKNVIDNGFVFEKNIFEKTNGLYKICDVNNDKNIDIINLDNTGEFKVKTVDSEGNIISESTLEIDEIKQKVNELLFVDINSDKQIDLLIVLDSAILLVTNNYPEFNTTKIEIENNENCTTYLKDGIQFNSTDYLNNQYDKLSFSKSDYYNSFYLNSDEVSFNNSLFYEDDIIRFSNSDLKDSIKRVIYSPMDFHTLKLDNSNSYYTIIRSKCKCGINFVFKHNKKEIQEISERTNLLDMNLQNFVFADVTDDGYKEVLAISEGKLKVYKNSNKIKKIKSSITQNTNFINYKDYTNDIILNIPSYKKFGKNQVYGNFNFSDLKRTKDGNISINDDYFILENYNYRVADNNINNITTNNLNQFSPDPFLENTTFTSNGLNINSLVIYNSNGKLVFNANPNASTFVWNGKSQKKSAISTGCLLL